MNEKDMTGILQELYAIEPKLRRYEVELKKVIVKFMQKKPKAEIDEAFKKELRAALLQKAREFEQLPKEDVRGFSWVKLFSFRNVTLTAVGTAAVIVIILITSNGTGNDGAPAQLSSNGLGVEELSTRAFGDLPVDSLQPTAGESGGGYGGGGTATAPDVQGTEPGAAAIPGFEGINYHYVYNGDLALPQDTLLVYKKVTDATTGSQAAEYLKNFGLDAVDLSTFSQAQLQNFSLTQDAEYGYTIEVNLLTGYLNISANNTWYQYSRCDGDVCPEYQPLAEGDIPADAEIISLADRFIEDHKINVENYGEPVINKYWLEQKTQNADGTEEAYVPDSLQVMYPLLIDGKRVYTTFGDTVGLQADVNLIENKVAGVSSIIALNMQSSPYPIETDAEKILDIAARGGFYEYSYGSPENTYEVELGDPVIAYVAAYENTGSQFSEFFVPALVFPVIGTPPVEYFYKKQVIVPLVSEFFSDQLDEPILLQETAEDAPVKSE
ncbi:MAG: hypothetical protein WC505_01320 [Patescibacteria group bacterium]